MPSDTFEHLLDRLVPGAGQAGGGGALVPDFPRALGLEPLELLARGGTGWVFRARDPVLDRVVAVKIGRADGGPAIRQALVEEARRTARLAHPAVLPVHRLVVADGRVCIEYALAPTATLEAMIHAPGVPDPEDLPPRLVHLRAVARALVRAHSLGMVHGDLHPGNVATGPEGAVYVLDWAGPPAEAGPSSFSGTPTHAAPELLGGAPASPASDLYSLGVLTWELCAGRPMRARLREDDLGQSIARWRTQEPPPLSGAVEPEVARLVSDCLARDPAARPDAASFAARLDQVLSGSAERARRHEQGTRLLDGARGLLLRYRELGLRLADEQQVVAILRARIPSHAPVAGKRPLWEAEDRVAELEQHRATLWLRGVEEATFAGILGDREAESKDMLAELWWTRMEDMASRGQEREVHLARAQVIAHSPEGRGRALREPCRLSPAVRPELSASGGEVALHRLVVHDRVLVPELAARLPLPVDRVQVEEGSWLAVVDVPGATPLRYPFQVARAEHHEAIVRPWTEAEIGPGWMLVPGGPFQLGAAGGPRQALPRCRPTLGDRLIGRAPVTTAEWLAWLAALPPEEAAARVPGERGLFGGTRPCWAPDGAGGWTLPEGWAPDWPILGVSLEDARAYARHRSEVEGRPVRLPTEEEWEKAARGVDGRAFPWGDAFDSTFANVRSSRPGPARPEPVGSRPVDRSIYGCVDMAGNAREWTDSVLESGQAVVRGGSWADEADDCRSAARSGVPPELRALTIGFRLVTDRALPARR